MWELNISIDSARGALIDGIMDDIAPMLKKSGGVMARGAGSGRDYLSIACECYNRPVVSDALREVVADLIITEFKLEYLKEHAKLPIHNPINYKAFIKALVVFDREFDRELVMRKLTFTREFMLDGFYNFRLKDLKRRWQEVCDLANNNAAYLTYHDTFMELLKFLVNTINSCLDEAHILEGGTGFKICTPDLKELDYSHYRIDKNINFESLVPALINLSPHKIVLHGTDNIPPPVISMLNAIFEDRVEMRDCYNQ